MTGRAVLGHVDSSPPAQVAAPPSEGTDVVLPWTIRTKDWALDKQWPVAAALVVVLALLWQLADVLGLLPEYIYSPAAIVGATTDLARSGDLTPLTLISLKREFSGFLVGAGLGVLIGLVAGVARWTGDVIDGAVSLLYPVPKIALLPIIAIWLGFTDSTRIVVIALACFFPAYLNAQSATRSIDPNLVSVARNAGASRMRTIAQVILPAALPRVMVGVRVALALSFVMMFATEVIGASAGNDAGLGGRAFAAGTNGDYGVLWAVLLTIAVLGVVLDTALRVFTARVVRGSTEEMSTHG